MKILITNVWLNNFAGSELVTLELYNYFSRQGHKVEIFTNTVSPEIEYFLKENDIRYSTPSSFVIGDEYDLVWVHHQNIPREFFENNPAIGKWIFHHMSPFEPLEFSINSEIENTLSDVILANSGETAKKLETLGLNSRKVDVFGNPAPSDFFNFPEEGKSDSYFLFITNHPPAEILGAMEALTARGEKIIHLGMGSKWAKARRVTPMDLAGAAVTVSIGKTIQYAIAMKKVFYIYDHFGGDGFTSSRENFEENLFFNFSGRSSRKVKSADEIVSELLNHATNDPFGLGYIIEEDFTYFNLDLRLQAILEELDSSEKLHFLDKVDDKQINVFKGTLETIRRSIVQEGHSSNMYLGAVAERDSAVAERDSAVAERDSAVAERDSAVAERDRVLNSTSWMLFKPYRKLKNIFVR
jgi:hypothetical protein